MLFWSPNKEHIYDFGELLHAEKVELKEECDAAGFLGVQLHRDKTTGHIHMTQDGLIKWIIKALRLDKDQTNSKETPAECKPLVKDENGKPQQDTFSIMQVLLECFCTYQDTPDLI